MMVVDDGDRAALSLRLLLVGELGACCLLCMLVVTVLRV